MINVVTDLVGKRVTVSMWLHKGDSADGVMTPLITGIMRAVGSFADHFTILIQTEIAHQGSRKPGALTMFSVGPKGGVEVVPEIETPAMGEYRALVKQLKVARDTRATSSEAVVLEAMEDLWWKLSQDERDVLDRDHPKKS